MISKLFIIFAFVPLVSFSALKSICGNTDDRKLSSDPKVGRVNDGVTSVCTVTMISENCALTAGHCYSILDEVSFNVPQSRNGLPLPSDEKSRYKVDRYETYYANNGPGDDYAVLSLLPNKVTGKNPGEAQGYYDVSFERVKLGDDVFVIGYGKDSRPSRNHSQQTHHSVITSLSYTTIEHTVDTRFGNSGSVIIDLVTNKIIGIHSHGACYLGGGSNYGTLISRHTRLSQGIKNCLAREFRTAF